MAPQLCMCRSCAVGGVARRVPVVCRSCAVGVVGGVAVRDGFEDQLPVGLVDGAIATGRRLEQNGRARGY